MEDNQEGEKLKNGLIYGLNDKPPFKEAFFAALQHLLAIFVAIITPPSLLPDTELDAETTGYLVSMALFASGISTFIQCRRFGGLGTGLLCIQGTSFSFIGPIIAAGTMGGLPLIFGSCIAASTVEMFISRILKYTKRIITPLISGIVVTLIGMSLIKWELLLAEAVRQRKRTAVSAVCAMWDWRPWCCYSSLPSTVVPTGI